MESKQVPKIQIFVPTDMLAEASEAGLGIEEEGISYEIIDTEDDLQAIAMESIQRDGLGICLTIDEKWVQVYCRQFKEHRALLVYSATDLEHIRIAGKNAARIIKRKPFILARDEGINDE